MVRGEDEEETEGGLISAAARSVAEGGEGTYGAGGLESVEVVHAGHGCLLAL